MNLCADYRLILTKSGFLYVFCYTQKTKQTSEQQMAYLQSKVMIEYFQLKKQYIIQLLQFPGSSIISVNLLIINSMTWHNRSALVSAVSRDKMPL